MHVALLGTVEFPPRMSRLCSVRSGLCMEQRTPQVLIPARAGQSAGLAPLFVHLIGAGEGGREGDFPMTQMHPAGQLPASAVPFQLPASLGQK